MTGTPPPRIPGLTYYPDDRPGIARRRSGRGFACYAPDGARIADPDERARIAAIAVPPAYVEVWISPLQNGHLQATDAMRAGARNIATTRAGPSIAHG